MIDMGGAERVGERVAKMRKLAGWTQRQLAERAFVSPSLVKKVEQGRIPASAAFTASCARALGLDPQDLHAVDPQGSIAELGAEVSGLAELREALHAFDDPRPGPPLGGSELARRVASSEELRRAQRFSDLALALPQLLHQLHARVAETPPGTAADESSRAMLHDTYRLVANVGGHFRRADIAAAASERHVQLAAAMGDPLRIALSDWHRSTPFLRHGLYSAGARLLERALAQLPAAAGDPQAGGMAAQLHLRSAVMAARSGDADRAEDHLREASERVTAGCSATPFPNTDASRLNVDVHWCAVPVEMDDGTESVRRAATVEIADRTRPERVAHHHIDQARAWLLHGDRERSLGELHQARRISPQQTRMHPSVHETVRGIADADRRTTGTLAGFARWAGIHL